MEEFIVGSAVFIYIILGLFVLLRNSRSATNVLFFLLNINIASWSVANYFATHTLDPIQALLWVRIVMFLAVPQAVNFFILIHTFPDNKIKIPNKYFFPYLGLTAFTMLLALSPFLFSGVEMKNNIPSPLPAPGIAVFILVAVGSVIAGLYVLLRKYHSAQGVQKLQLRIIFVGIFTMFALILTFNFILVVFMKNSNFIPSSALYTLPFVIATAYTIIKHRLLDIRLVVARSVAYLLVLTFIALIYSFCLFTIVNFFAIQNNKTVNLIISVFLALVIALSFQPLKKLLEKATNTFLFKELYDSNILLANLSHIMASTLSLSDLVGSILDELKGQLKFAFGYIILLRDSKIIWLKGVGKTEEKFTEEIINFLVKKALAQPQEHMFVFDDLEESPIKVAMRAHNMNIFLPLEVENETVGILVLSEKSSGEMYSSTDTLVLKILAPEAAVAIKNALSYEEIKRFNVTLREEVEQATASLTNANEKLKVLDKLKDEFVSVASHELRTPMTAIKSYLWMALAGKGGNLTEKQKYYLDRAYNSTDRLIKLVNDMLNVSRIESGRVTVEVGKTDIIQICEEVLIEVKPRAEEIGLSVKVNYPPQPLPPVLADSDKIKEVLINLIGNSLKFTPPGGSITLSFEVKGDTVITHVRDTGKGIEVADIPKLFQKFGLLKGSYTSNQVSQGTGLGLYICKSIITLHRGEIWGNSEGANKGAEFSFSLKIYNDKLASELLGEQKTREGIEMIPTQI